MIQISDCLQFCHAAESCRLSAESLASHYFKKSPIPIKSGHSPRSDDRGSKGAALIYALSIYLQLYLHTFVLLAGEGALAAGEDPEHQVGHPEGEADDGVAEEDRQHAHYKHPPCRQEK